MSGPFLLVSTNGDAPRLSGSVDRLLGLLEPEYDGPLGGEHLGIVLLERGAGFHAIEVRAFRERTWIPWVVRAGRRVCTGGLLMTAAENEAALAVVRNAAPSVENLGSLLAAGPQAAACFDRLVIFFDAANRLERD